MSEQDSSQREEPGLPLYQDESRVKTTMSIASKYPRVGRNIRGKAHAARDVGAVVSRSGIDGRGTAAVGSKCKRRGFGHVPQAKDSRGRSASG